MDDDIVGVLMSRAGSQLRAASMIGVSARHVQNWCCGHSSPSKKSVMKIVCFLDGDEPTTRESRIVRYAERAERGEPLFRGARRA
jgi:hypothetical protein